MNALTTTAIPLPQFAAAAHSSRSSKYTYIPTNDIINALAREGFHAVASKQTTPRKDLSRIGFTKHMVRLRHESSGEFQALGSYPEIVLTNAHDGTGGYQCFGGLFRMFCFNGLVVSDSRIECVSIPHKGDVVGQVIEGTYSVLKSVTEAARGISEWTNLQLTASEQLAYAEAAHELRFDRDEEGKPLTAIEPAQLLKVRRREDEGNDLWRVFNRVQESVVRGGIDDVRPFTNERGRQKWRHLKSKPVTSKTVKRNLTAPSGI